MKNTSTVVGFAFAILFLILYLHTLWIYNQQNQTTAFNQRFRSMPRAIGGANGANRFFRNRPFNNQGMEFDQSQGNNGIGRQNRPWMEPDRFEDITPEELMKIRRDYPELADSIEGLIRIRPQVRNAIDQIFRATTQEERDNRINEFKKLLYLEFDLEIKRQELEVRKLENRIGELKEKIDIKRKDKMRIIEFRVNDVINRPPPPLRYEPMDMYSPMDFDDGIESDLQTDEQNLNQQ